jgi:hypothetical protein
MAITPELARIYTSAPDGEAFFETLELSHPAFAASHFVTPAEAFAATLEDGRAVSFIRVPFQLQLPGSSAQGPGALVFTIDNVDREIGDELERAAAQSRDPIMLTWRVFVSSDLSQPAADPIRLEVRDVEATAATVSAQAIPYDAVNRRWPSVLFDTRLFPGLDR